MSTCSGPCLPHCYSCPETTVTLSHAAVVLASALVAVVICTLLTDKRLGEVLTPSQREFFLAMRRRRIACFAFGGLIGVLVLRCWRPYTPYKFA